MQFSKAALALSLTAAAGLSGFTALSPAPAEALTRCSGGTLLGRYALKSNLNNKYIRAGIGADSAVGATSSRIGGNKSWETFDIYDLGNRNGLNGGTYALRSTQDPNRWVSVANNKALKLKRGCNTNSRNRLFVANKVGNTLQLQSLSNRQWVIQRSNNMLHANASTAGGNVPKALQYRMIRVSAGSGSGSNSTPPSNQQQVNLNGWLKGNNKGVYSAQRSGNNFQMKGFLNGKPFNLITGTIQGNIINASWKNYCNNSTGSLKLRIERNRLVKVGGNPGFNTSWTPTQKPASISSRPDCNDARNLNGTWRGNNGGTYVVRQTGSIVSWSGRGGNFKNIFIGQRQGNTVSGFWQDTASSQTQNSGRLTFKVVNGSKLVRMSHTGSLGNSSWSR
ncbi:hypothetical protein SynPROS71_02720 [Synechococcus sp. PROS-7-1]|uniref:fascin domain-containing protein n=1 Tax=Synechococcus sp. PROS-7-1 TaxID=1442556 RepID=UPI001861BA41|nr:hypothetical protein [Synechococcus sp. PROS-7-1]QNI86479.1 hypothetical protein SynPROS71_02720 [Synechococcus sp. PROS-7-1]